MFQVRLIIKAGLLRKCLFIPISKTKYNLLEYRMEKYTDKPFKIQSTIILVKLYDRFTSENYRKMLSSASKQMLTYMLDRSVWLTSASNLWLKKHSGQNTHCFPPKRTKIVELVRVTTKHFACSFCKPLTLFLSQILACFQCHRASTIFHLLSEIRNRMLLLKFDTNLDLL